MISIKVDAKDIKRLQESLSKTKLKAAQTRRVAQGVVDTMKDQISKGISPIQSAGRFPAYKNPRRYPGNLKPQRPVNLNLTGDMLAALTAKVDSPTTFQIGYFKSSEAIKEQGHRDGANGQPKRPTIPQGSESFNRTINLQMANDFASALDEELSKVGK